MIIYPMRMWTSFKNIVYRNLEALFCTGVLFWVAIAYMLQLQLYSLSTYLIVLLKFAALQAPVILYFWFKPWLQRKLTAVQYHSLWLFCLIIFPYSIVLLISTYDPASLLPPFWISGVSVILFLQLLLLINAWYQKKVRHWGWIQRMDLERAVLISITLIAIAWAIMAASSWGDPAYHNKERLLLGFRFSPKKIWANPGRFLSLTIQFIIMNLCGYFYFFVNNRVLVPVLLKQKGFIYYSLGVLTLIGVTYPLFGQLLASMSLNHLLGGIFPEDPFKLESAFAALAIILVSLPVVLATQWARQNNQIVSLEKEKTQTELDLLKQQLDPHFFFNTLNNLYALSLQQSKQTPESILQLSELMRYVIYKAKEPTVSIHDEIKYVQDYIDLQQIRLKKKLEVQFQQEVQPDAPPIAPLLLIVLVENAFKHGIEPAENNALLHLHLKIENKQFCFSCINSVEGAPGSTPGIGLSNLRRRLSLLYPGKYMLETVRENHTFKVKLKVDLS